MSRTSSMMALAAFLAGLTVVCARADAIDGDWCAADGRHMTIRGPAITTPRGHQLTGDYARHSFSYTVPAGEPDAGATLAMLLLNEQTVKVKTPTAEEIWRRCSAVTS